MGKGKTGRTGKGNPKKRSSKKVDQKNFKPEGKSEAYDEAKSGGASNFNDLADYVINDQILNDSASIPTNLPAGTAVPNFGMNQEGEELIFPGILKYEVISFPGVTRSFNDPINVAARNIMAYLRIKNSKQAPYDPADVMMTLLAGTELITWGTVLGRVYGLLNLYNPINRYFPKAIIESMGFDFNDLIGNMADFRAYLNQLAIRSNAWSLPKSFAYLRRKHQMFQALYVDGTADKAQVSYYMPAAYGIYNPADVDGGSITPTEFKISGTGAKLSDIVSFGDKLEQAFMSVEHNARIIADLRTAYSEGDFITLPLFNELYIAPIEYNYEVLMQMQNADINAFDSTQLPLTEFKIRQDTKIGPGIILCDPHVKETDYNNASRYTREPYRLMNFNLDVVKPGDIVVATRLKHMWTRGVQGTARLSTIGTEYLYRVTSYSMREDASLRATDIKPYYVFRENTAAKYLDIAPTLRMISDLSAIKYHPLLMLTAASADGAKWQDVPLWEIDNWTEITVKDLIAINNMVVYKLMLVTTF